MISDKGRTERLDRRRNACTIQPLFANRCNVAHDPVTHPLDKLLRPRSVAIVGASDTPDTNGQAMLQMCRIDGYKGAVLPVNPRLTRIDDLPCYPSLAALPRVPDHVIIGVASALVEGILDEAITLGVPSATIFASCHLGAEPAPRLAQRIADKARAAGMALCGANCMGFYTPGIGLRVGSMPSPAGLRPGGIAWIAQSGSALGALAHNDRRLGFSLCVSTGMELVTTAADYMDWALSQPETRVIGLFLETVRDPARFVAMLARAVERRVPVVVLKVGRTEASAQMAVSHTGAIAGNDAAFEALFRKYGVTRVADLDEMAATLALFDGPRVAGPGGFGSIHDSGGERELVVDLADEIGLDFAPLNPATEAAMAAHLELGLKPENPLDAYGTSRDVEQRFAALTAAMMADPNVALGLFMANPRDGYPYAEKYTAAVKAAAATTDKPLALASNFSLAKDSDLALSLKAAGVPLLRGTKNALLAVRHALAYRDFHARAAAEPPMVPELPDAWRARLGQCTALTEAEGLALLDHFGIAVPRHAPVDSDVTLARCLDDMTYPLTLKTAEDIAHKSDAGGVILNLADRASVLAAYRDLAKRLGPRVLVMEMAPKGVELALGAVWDAGFGPVVLISAGGVFIEILGDTAAALAPFDETEALRLIEGLRIHPILRGARGQPAVDLQALATQIARFSVLAASLGARAREIDVNPLICSPSRIVAVDCLILP